MATQFMDTFDSVSIDSPEGKKFLRRVANRPEEGWIFWTSAAAEWRGEFRRKIESRTGDASAVVTVETDVYASVYGQPGEVGEEGDTTTIPAVRFVSTNGANVAALLLAGFRLRLSYDRGSIRSREEGLAFLRLSAHLPNNYGGGVDLESTVTKNGRILCGINFCCG